MRIISAPPFAGEVNVKQGHKNGNKSASGGKPTLADLYAQRAAPTADWSDMGSLDHFVQFYQNDQHFIESVSEYFTHCIRVGDTSIVVATASHHKKIDATIRKFGVDLDAARGAGKFYSYDADEMLSKFMKNGKADEKKFHRMVEEVLSAAAGRNGRIRIFGEMVAILALDGNFDAALHLEEMWSTLHGQHSFSLFCAYPTSAFKTKKSVEALYKICDDHTKVIPDESYTSLTNTNDRMREIALLQQRANWQNEK